MIESPTPPSPKERLEKTGVTVEESPDAPEFHAPIRVDGFEGVHGIERALKKTADICRSYATAPIIRDSWGNDHGKRQDWIGTIGEELWLYVREGKLRANRIGGVEGHLEALVYLLDTDNVHTPQAEEVRLLHAAVPHDAIRRYGELTPEEKEAVITKLDSICRSFLRLVTGTKG